MLVARYKLHGDTLDSSGFGNHGTIVGSVPYADGKIFQAGQFSYATGSRIEIPHNSFLSSKIFGASKILSFSFWCNLTAYQNYGHIINKCTAGSWSNTTSGVWITSVGISFTLGANVSENPAGSNVRLTTAPTLNVWHNIVCTCDGTTMRIYVDGTLATSTSTAGLTLPRTENTAPIRIGDYVTATNNGIHGRIEDLRIYDHCLSVKEVIDVSSGKCLSINALQYIEPTYNWLNPRNDSLNTYHPSYRPYSGVGHGTSATSTEVAPPVAGLTVYRVDDNAVDTQNVRYSLRFNIDSLELWDKDATLSYWIYLPGIYAGRYTSMTFDAFQNTTGTDWHSFRGYDTTFAYYGAGTIRTGFKSLDINKVDCWQKISISFKALTANKNLPVNNGLDNNIWVAGSIRVNVSGAINNGTPYHLYISGGQLEHTPYFTEFTFDERNGVISDGSKYDNHFRIGRKEYIEEHSKANVSFTNKNTITKTATTSAWDAGFRGKTLYLENCFLEWSLHYPSTGGAEMVGLTTAYTGWSFSTIRYCIYTRNNGTIRIYENGSDIGLFGNWSKTSNDIFRIEARYGKIYYFMNGALLRVSTLTYSGPLFTAMSLHSHGSANQVIIRGEGVLNFGGIIPKKGNNSFLFNGSNTGITLPMGTQCFAEEFTITAVCNFYDDTRGIILSNYNNTSNTIGFEKLTSRRLSLGVNFPGIDVSSPVNSFQLNTWHNIAVKKTSTQVMFFVDGVKLSTSNASTTYGAVDFPMLIGRDIRTGETVVNGEIREIEVFATALSDDVIINKTNVKSSIDKNGNLHSPLLLEELRAYDSIVKKNNLVENGTLYYNSAYNFPGFTYNTGGYVVRTGTASTDLMNNYIPVESTTLENFDVYTMEFEIKAAGTNSKYYAGIACYDINKRFISHHDVQAWPNTATTLTADLIAGQTTVQLTSAANWNTSGTASNKFLALWHPNDPAPYTPLKYSFRVIYYSSVSGNTLTLSSAYSGDTIPAGSPVQNHYSGGTYSYIAAVNPFTTNDWVFRSGTTFPTAHVDSMRYATKFIRPLFLLNREGGGTTTHLRNVKIYNVTKNQSIPLENEQFIPGALRAGGFKANQFSEIGPSENLVIYMPFNGDIKNYTNNNVNIVNYLGTHYYEDALNGLGLVSSLSETSYIGVENLLSQSVDGFSISINFRISAASASKRIVWCNWIGPGNGFVLWQTATANQIQFGISEGTTQRVVNAGSISYNIWHNAIFTYYNKVLSCYVDGVLVGTNSSITSFTMPNKASYNINIGQTGVFAVSEFKLFSKKLELKEVKTIADLYGFGSKSKMNKNEFFVQEIKENT